MNWLISPFSFFYLIPAGIILTAAIYIWIRHTIKPSRILAILMFAISLWNLANFVQVSAGLGIEKIFWQKISLVFCESSVLLFLVFALSLTDRQRWFTRRWMILGVIPAAIFVSVAITNEHHYLYWQGFTPSPTANSNLLIFEHGPFLWANLVFLYLIYSIACIIILSTVSKKSSNLYNDFGFILISILFPPASNLFELTNLGPYPGLDLTSVIYLIPTITFSIVLGKLQMMSLIPISRSKLIENMSDSILVLNNYDQVLDLNPAAQTMLGVTADEAIGQKAPLLFRQWPEISEGCCNISNTLSEVKILDRFFEMRATLLTDYNNQTIGRLIVFRDISEQKKTEQAETEQRLFAEALSRSAEAINSSLDLEDVFGSILYNLDTVVPHDVSNILMINSEGYAEVACSRGYEESHIDADYLQTIQMKIAEIPSYSQMIATKRPFLSPDTHNDPNWIIVPGQEWIRSYLGAPIIVREKVVGFINLDSMTSGFFTPKHAEHLKVFTQPAGIAVENARLFSEVQKIAITDDLTGLSNRRHLFALGEVEFERCRRYHHLLSAILMDIDWFKQVNDTYGHLSGDQVLRAIGKLCLESTRKVDIIGRYGGEEILILLPETNSENTANTAERLRLAIEQMSIHTDQGEIHITASFGVAYFNPYSDKRLIELVERADEALYSAKRLGRNRVQVYSYGFFSPDQVLED